MRVTPRTAGAALLFLFQAGTTGAGLVGPKLRERFFYQPEAALLDPLTKSHFIRIYRWRPQRPGPHLIRAIRAAVVLDAPNSRSIQERFAFALEPDAFVELRFLSQGRVFAAYRHSRFTGRRTGFYRLEGGRYQLEQAAARQAPTRSRLEIRVRQSSIWARLDGALVAIHSTEQRCDGFELSTGLWPIQLLELEVSGDRRVENGWKPFKDSLVGNRPERSAERKSEHFGRFLRLALVSAAIGAALIGWVAWRRRRSLTSTAWALLGPPLLLVWAWIPTFQPQWARVGFAGLLVAAAQLLALVALGRDPAAAIHPLRRWLVCIAVLIAAESGLRQLPRDLWVRGFFFDDRELRGQLDIDFWRDDRFGIRTVNRGAHPASFRLLVLGGSSVRGFPYRESAEAFPARLERALNQRFGSAQRRIEVLNAGVLGFSTFQEWRALVEILGRYQPDAVIIYGWFNDSTRIPRWFHTQPYLTDAQASQRLLEQLGGPGPARWRMWLGRSRLVGLLRAALLEAIGSAAITTPKSAQLPPRGTTAEVQRHLTQAALELRRRGVLVGLCPEAYAYAPTLRRAAGDNADVAAVARAARAADAALLDVLTPLERRSEDPLFLDLIHPSRLGHAAIADALAGEIERHGWIGAERNAELAAAPELLGPVARYGRRVESGRDFPASCLTRSASK